MMNCLSDTIENAAKEAVGNWYKFDSFCWYDKPVWAENAFIFYYQNRDSTLIDISNAKVWEEEMGKFSEKQVRGEDHNHWAVGWVRGFAIRVYWRDGSITPAFRKWYEIQKQLDNYPVLDSDDYSNKETEATIENFENAAHGKVKENPPEGWAGKLIDYCYDKNYNCCTESRDDNGGYPCDNHLIEALIMTDLIDEDVFLDYIDSHPILIERIKEYFSLTGPSNPDTVRNCEKHGCSYLPGDKCPKC